MATNTTSQGPVPFKDVSEDTVPMHPPKEYEELVSTLPNKQVGKRIVARCYQGAWMHEAWIPGIIAMQHHFVPRSSDIILASVPKCGTTWLKALAFAVMTRSAYPLDEHPLLRLNPHDCVPFLEERFTFGQEEKLDALPSPRLICTHLPYSLLPVSIIDVSNCKIVYIYREPKDMVVSLWHFLKRVEPDVSFSDIFEAVCEGTVAYGPFWDHVLGYWSANRAQPEKVLMLKYEDIMQDPSKNIKSLAQFLGQPFSDAEEEAGMITRIMKLCSFENLRALEVNKIGLHSMFKFPSDAFFRKGIVGDWVNYMTPEMASRLDNILVDKFHGSGLDSRRLGELYDTRDGKSS